MPLSVAAGIVWLGASVLVLAFLGSAGILWAGAPRSPQLTDVANDSRSTTGNPTPVPARSRTARQLSELLGRPLSATAGEAHAWTDLHYAAVVDLPGLVRDLLNAGANADAESNAASVNLDIVEALLGHAGGMDWLAYIEFEGLTSLHVAASGQVVATLLQGGADLHARDSRGNTPLHMAAYRDAPDVVASLLAHGADIDATTDFFSLGPPLTHYGGLAPLHNAAYRNSHAAVVALLEHGAHIDVRGHNGNSPIHDAADGNAAEVIMTLLERGADANARTRDNTTPLHRVADGTASDVVAALVERGADVNVTDRNGWTPLHRAASSEFGETSMMRALLAGGADVHASDNEGLTPLHHAARNFRPRFVTLLLEHGAEVDAADEAGRTPLHVARQKDVVTELLAWSADVHARDAVGETPLHHAVRWKAGHRWRDGEVVTALLAVGADVHARNADGLTPFHLVGEDDLELKALLRQYRTR